MKKKGTKEAALLLSLLNGESINTDDLFQTLKVKQFSIFQLNYLAESKEGRKIGVDTR